MKRTIILIALLLPFPAYATIGVSSSPYYGTGDGSVGKVDLTGQITPYQCQQCYGDYGGYSCMGQTTATYGFGVTKCTIKCTNYESPGDSSDSGQALSEATRECVSSMNSESPE